nr:MAG TPA: hypothetical protein [Caudoviricetes sp.]
MHYSSAIRIASFEIFPMGLVSSIGFCPHSQAGKAIQTQK